MAYDEELAGRVRQLVEDVDAVTERRMFGGLAFLVGGNMAVAASGRGSLMVRVDPGTSAELVDPPRVDRMEMRGRRLDGWLLVTDDGTRDDDELRRWVDLGVGYARSLPPK